MRKQVMIGKSKFLVIDHGWLCVILDENVNCVFSGTKEKCEKLLAKMRKAAAR